MRPSLPLRMQGLEVLRRSHLPLEAAEAKGQILLLLQSSTSRFASRDNLIAAGRYFVDRGEDAKKVLNLFYDRVREADPSFLEAYIATAELALDKGDYKVAADTLQAAERAHAIGVQAKTPESIDPRIKYLLARAWSGSKQRMQAKKAGRVARNNCRFGGREG